MIEFITGKLIRKAADHCVISVGGIGFHIGCTPRTLNELGEPGEETTVYTYMQVKEDDISLFGFISQEELSLFQLLISVNGVGPKMALSVLSSMSPASFSVAVAKGDYKSISAGKGIGPKLAQRMILELKDKIKAAASEEGADNLDFLAGEEVGGKSDIISALTVLGYSAGDATRAVNAVYKDGLPEEELVKLALRQLMK